MVPPGGMEPGDLVEDELGAVDVDAAQLVDRRVDVDGFLDDEELGRVGVVPAGVDVRARAPAWTGASSS